jgi:glycine/D-amino acid oxidase-like deaminating enzyme
VLAITRFRLTASAYVPGAAAVGVEQRIRAVLADRVPDSDPDVHVTLTDQVTVAFTLSADSATEARAIGRLVADDVLLGAAPIALDAVELFAAPPVPA